MHNGQVPRRASRQKRRAGSTGSSSRGPLTFLAGLPKEPVPIDTGTAAVERDRDHPERVTLLVNGAPSSFVDLGDPAFLAFEYMQQMNCVLDQRPSALRVLHLGAGACSLATALDASHPGSRQVAVDIDARLLELVRSWFPLPRAPRLKLRPGDAAEVVRAAPPASFDVVVRDVFAGTQTPSTLTTTEFATDVTRVLRPGGLYLANCADRPPLSLARRELATLRGVFVPPDGSACPMAAIGEVGVLKGRRFGNVVLVAQKPAPSDDDAGATTDPGHRGFARQDPWGLESPALARKLRTLPVPANVLTDGELSRFVGTAPPII